MSRTYEPIASTTLGSATATISFTSIPSTYTDLVVVLFTGTTHGDNEVMQLTFNSDTGSNYSMTRLYGNGSSAVSDRFSSQTYIDAGFMPQANPGICIINVMSYANTSVNKTCLISAETINSTNTSANRRIVIREVGLWRSTSAITSMTFDFASGNFQSGSTAALYGIKAA
jgi:hypothetical protein